jgi:guanylate kinase
MQRRLRTAGEEVGAFGDYDFVVINDELTGAVERLRSIVLAERSRLKQMRKSAERIARTFEP